MIQPDEDDHDTPRELPGDIAARLDPHHEGEAQEPQGGETGRSASGVGSRAQGEAVSLVSAGEALSELFGSWEGAREEPTSTGVPGLDAALYGGLRSGAVVIVGAPAGAGKSILAAQVAYDAAASGAVVVYASVEMAARELGARWLAMRAFRERVGAWGDASHRGQEKPATFGELLFGMHDRAPTREVALQRAAEAVRKETGGRLFVQTIRPGSCVQDLARAVDAARERAGVSRCLLVVDPLQRLYAATEGREHIDARALNRDETERMTYVAQQLKDCADRAGLAVWCNSDTTKAAVAAGANSETSLRGSYMLNHAATLVLGLSIASDPEASNVVDAFAIDGRSKDAAKSAAKAAMPRWWNEDPRTRASLGGRVAVLESSKNRHNRAPGLVGVMLRAVSLFATAPDEAPDVQAPTRGRKR